MTLNERLIFLKESRHLLQKDIANHIGISLRSYQRYEYGEREPSASILISLATYFEVSVDYLLGRTDNPKVNK